MEASDSWQEEEPPQHQHWMAEPMPIYTNSFLGAYETGDSLQTWNDARALLPPFGASTQNPVSEHEHFSSAPFVNGYTLTETAHIFPDPAQARESAAFNAHQPTDWDARRSKVEAPTPHLLVDIDSPYEGNSRRPVCAECRTTCETLVALDRHAQSESHKAWSCPEAGCSKSYARRDTFLRHCAIHSDNGYPCTTCCQAGKKKLFKRKDHLKEHERSCHPQSTERTRPRSDSARDHITGIEHEIGHGDLSIATEAPFPQDQQAIIDLTNSLAVFLEDRRPDLMANFRNSVIGLQGHEIQSIAESMIEAALANSRHRFYGRQSQGTQPIAQSMAVAALANSRNKTNGRQSHWVQTSAPSIAVAALANSGNRMNGRQRYGNQAIVPSMAVAALANSRNRMNGHQSYGYQPVAPSMAVAVLADQRSLSSAQQAQPLERGHETDQGVEQFQTFGPDSISEGYYDMFPPF